ncbi:hypothetical protein TBLA_0B05560 [Henningerozyma blattae CBS 6284]|uniref:Splicing factor YJU2 n=1 Tax=Henningerozyma blattae (strain ATCC 34711 / CBS 6284 / DSM 70876 / NBRC 10599 / NRRL Y-10934 / UCD 77-7) TaxID=1071380 RepID=I2GZ32_HENB6|nr:hypothetical protein TBLA_0B05560 [Tetrapisispora blattae CBS 6284]CCH59384.1 hypothetical protein TBLA_0B05560 [Tetrapisispora blattae CBS 6284]
MSERKSINKYYPPDYNPLEAEKAAKKLSKKLKTTNKDVVTIRLMMPFSARCLKCSEFIAKGRKFNGKKALLNEKYLETIKIYRMSIRCPGCSNQISFKTDPKSADYIIEVGAERNFVTNRKEEEKNAEETIEMTMDRLAKERELEQAAKTGEKNNIGQDKMKVLEDRLTKLQTEQQQDEELENLKNSSYLARRRAEIIQNERELQHIAAEQDLDRLVTEKFREEQKKN